MSQWRDPPRVVILSGDEDYLRVRELREAVSVADESGRSVEYVRGTHRDEISRVLSSTGIFFQEDVLLVVEEPEPVDADLIVRHHENGTTGVSVLLYQEGKIKAGTGLAKVADALPPRLVAKFDKPKPWEEEDHAVHFCAKEARRREIDLPDVLAHAIVRHVGPDLGMLNFEIEKLALYANVLGIREVTQQHVKKTLGAFKEIGPKPVVDAVGQRDLRTTVGALANMRRTHAGNLASATMRVCAFVSRAARDWLHVRNLLSEGAEPGEISDRVGTHPFVIRKNLLPVAKRWTETGLVALLKSIAKVERSVRSGQISPWVQLECALLGAVSKK